MSPPPYRKEDKIYQAESAVKAAEDLVTSSRSSFDLCSARCLREVARFKAEKAADMKRTVLDYITLQIEFNRKMEETWTKLVPELEGVSLGGGKSGLMMDSLGDPGGEPMTLMVTVWSGFEGGTMEAI